jgi:RNA polymerase sigma-70 factor, ECF subfamily
VGADPARARELLAIRLYAQHRQPLLRYLLRIVGDRQRGEDLVQETMLRAWLHADRLYDDEAAVRGWLFRVAHNVAVDELRYRRIRPAHLTPEPGVHLVAPDPIEPMVNRIDLGRALERLSPAQRTVLTEVYLGDRSIQEVAQALRIPYGTAKSRLHHGLRHLRGALCRPAEPAPATR